LMGRWANGGSGARWRRGIGRRGGVVGAVWRGVGAGRGGGPIELGMKVPLFKLVVGGSVGVFAGLAAWLGWGSVRSDIEAAHYKDEARRMAGAYAELRDQYNEAVRRTAVTELVVSEAGVLLVRLRDATGVLREVETPYDPRAEIYVDYALIDGRRLVRRVFDEFTPPSSGTLVDPGLEFIDWSDPGATFGKAVYRALGPGRWVVSMTGTGSLGLTRLGESEEAELVPPPEVKDFEEMERELEAELRDVTPGEVLRRLVR